jgi:hypothetical protein
MQRSARLCPEDPRKCRFSLSLDCRTLDFPACLSTYKEDCQGSCFQLEKCTTTHGRAGTRLRRCPSALEIRQSQGQRAYKAISTEIVSRSVILRSEADCFSEPFDQNVIPIVDKRTLPVRKTRHSGQQIIDDICSDNEVVPEPPRAPVLAPPPDRGTV